MTRSLPPTAALLAALILPAACVTTPEVVARDLQPKPNFFLRGTGMDQDPSPYLGRFVPDDATPATIDEAAAMQLTCTKHIRVRKVPAAGITFDEYLSAGTSASGWLGLQEAGAKASASRSRVVRVRYTTTEKWIADIVDPAAFDACCQRASGQCTKRMIGEFVAGTGAIYAADEHSASGGVQTPEGGAEVKDGVQWRRMLQFQQPAFFAFKLTNVGPKPQEALCDGAWDSRVPSSSQGYLFVGVSDWLESDRLAREAAMGDARLQVVRYLGEQIAEGKLRTEHIGGRVGALKAALQEDKTVTRAAAGVARYVKDRCWKDDSHQGPEGWRYHAKVLAFLPNASVEEAAAAVEQVVPEHRVE